MRNNTLSKDLISIRFKDSCVSATGNLAQSITAALVITIILIGIASLIKAAK